MGSVPSRVKLPVFFSVCGFSAEFVVAEPPVFTALSALAVTPRSQKKKKKENSTGGTTGFSQRCTGGVGHNWELQDEGLGCEVIMMMMMM